MRFNKKGRKNLVYCLQIELYVIVKGHGASMLDAKTETGQRDW